MRSSLAVGLALVLALALPALAADLPIPQDQAKLARRRLDRLEWVRRNLGGAYDRVGKKDPRWDKLAGAAFELAARQAVREPDPMVTFEEVIKAAGAAMDAGCDDPMLVHLFNHASSNAGGPGGEEASRRLQGSARAVAAGRYPAFRRASALELAAGIAVDLKQGDAGKREAEQGYDAVLALLPAGAASDERNEFSEERWAEILIRVIAGYRALGLEPTAAYRRVDAGLAEVPEFQALRLVVRGDFWRNYGWEARTSAFAPQVPEDAFKLFRSRCEDALKAFEGAWKLRPDARIADRLLAIEKSIGGDRENMELWFDRTLKLDGDSRDACFSKLDWLDPQWYGTAEEMLAFGRRCRDSKNWRAGITLLCADAHNRHASHLAKEERWKYLATPEVWSDITSVYDEYLGHYPADHVARSKYASLAYSARRHVEAHAQFQKLGDHLTSWNEFPYVPLPGLKIYRDISAKAAARADAPRKKAATP